MKRIHHLEGCVLATFKITQKCSLTINELIREENTSNLFPPLLFRPPKLFPDPPSFLELLRLLVAPTLENGFFSMLITAGPVVAEPLKEDKRYCLVRYRLLLLYRLPIMRFRKSKSPLRHNRRMDE